MGDTYSSISQAYADTLIQVMAGRLISPRGMGTLELVGHSFTIEDPRQNLVVQRARKISLPFAAAECLWIILGLNDSRLISTFNKQMAASSDDGIYHRGAYGPKLVDQLPYIIETLQRDPASRQAVLTLWRERPGPSKDYPCTNLMQFMIRDQMLEMVVYMRSNDCWLGMPYDIFTFTMIQGMLASALGVGWGPYHHHVGSLHLYERDWDKAQEVMTESISGIDQRVFSPQLTWPQPKHILAYFGGFAAWGDHPDVAGPDSISWLDSGGMGYTDWDWLIRMCAYKFHKDPSLLPEELQRLIWHWRVGA